MKVKSSSIVQEEKDRTRSRCRKWRLVANTGQGRRFRRFNGTYTQAQEALERWVRELEGLVPNADTFGAYAESWRLWREKSGGLAPGTLANDRREVNALLRTGLAGMRMDAVTAPACRDALMWLKANPVRATKSGELSNTTMNSLHICLHSILQQAADDGLIAGNPMASVRAPRPDTKEKEALSPGELMELLGSLAALPLDGRVMAVYFMALLGLRRAEACALADSDVSDTCRVDKAVKERDGSIAEPKSPASKRTLPMPSLLSERVDEWRVARKSAGLSGAPTLCCNTRGGVLRPQLLQRWWSGDSCHVGVRDSLGCEGVTLHQLRHSNLSMMARHMSPFDLQRYAGWSSIEPARVYVHADDSALRSAVSDAWD